MKFFSLRWKLAGLLLVSNFLLGILLVFIVNYTVTESLEKELIERGRTIAQDIAQYSAPQILDEDRIALKEIITGSLSSESVEYIIIHDYDLQILTDTYNGQVPIEIAQTRIDNNEMNIKPETINIPSINLKCYDIIVPVEDGELGYIRVGMKINYIENRVTSTISFIIYAILGVTLIGIILTYFLANKIIRPILYLTKRANEISKGQLEEKISLETNDEINYLAEAVERLRESLNLALAKLKKYQTQRI